MIPKRQAQYALAYLLLVLFAALSLAYRCRWFAEDAYISARYARNLVEGHGLVFNPGERVEGYTNFLWTLLLAAGLRCGFDVQSTGMAFGLLFTALSFLFLYGIHRKVYEEQKYLFPVALAAIGLNYTWACFSTSGLETSLLCFLLICSAYLLFVAETKPVTTSHFLLIGTLCVFLLMTRPDTIFFLVLVFVYVGFFRQSRERKKEILFFLIPLFALYAPYFLWRLNYYGFLFPNTFYAKSADQAYYSQGVQYVWRFLSNYMLWAWIPVLIYVSFKLFQRIPKHRILLLLLLYCIVHTAWVVRIGGDFMDGRFLVILVPFLYLFLEFGIRNAPVRRWIQVTALGCLVLSSALHRPVPREYRANITDERTWTPVFELWYREGEIFRNHLPPSTLIATDGVGAFGYSSRMPIVDTLGLTDAYVSRLPLSKRGSPGHEKFAPVEYLEQRRVDILRDGMQRSINKELLGTFSGYKYYLLSEKPHLLRQFRKILSELQALENSSPATPVP